MRRSALRLRIEERAKQKCEYCHAPQFACGYTFHIEHIVPRAAGGSNEETNLALSCAMCNLAKSQRTTSTDPLTQKEAPLFNPRTQLWQEHFRWNIVDHILVGSTPIGRAAVNALNMNHEIRQSARQLWFTVGLLP